MTVRLEAGAYRAHMNDRFQTSVSRTKEIYLRVIINVVLENKYEWLKATLSVKPFSL